MAPRGRARGGWWERHRGGLLAASIAGVVLTAVRMLPELTGHTWAKHSTLGLLNRPDRPLMAVASTGCSPALGLGRYRRNWECAARMAAAARRDLLVSPECQFDRATNLSALFGEFNVRAHTNSSRLGRQQLRRAAADWFEDPDRWRKAHATSWIQIGPNSQRYPGSDFKPVRDQLVDSQAPLVVLDARGFDQCDYHMVCEDQWLRQTGARGKRLRPSGELLRAVNSSGELLRPGADLDSLIAGMSCNGLM